MRRETDDNPLVQIRLLVVAETAHRRACRWQHDLVVALHEVFARLRFLERYVQFSESRPPVVDLLAALVVES